nr:hypothetical protein [Candidatus Thorarchaeota archaeon]
GQSAFLESSVIGSNLDNGRYTRTSLSIKRDKRDIDDDGITQEFVPILFFGTVIHRSFIQESGEWYTFSVKDALGTPDETTIESNTDADLSLFEIKFPIPIEVDRTQTTLPDNPMFEYKGKMVYHLKAGEDTAAYDDITVAFNMLNITKELNTMPIVTGGFFVGDGGRTYKRYDDGGTTIYASEIPFITSLSNTQNETRIEATAEDVHVFLPVPEHFIQRIEYMKEWYYNETEIKLDYRDFVSTDDNWEFATFTIDRKQHFGLKAQIDDIPAGDEVTLTFNLTIFPQALFKLFGREWFYIYFQMGPLFHFHDSNGRRYSGFANGFAFIMKKISLFQWNSSATVGVTMPTGGTMVDERELKMRFNFTVGILSFGTNAIENVTVDLFRARSKGYFGYQTPEKVDSEWFDKAKLNDITLTNMSFTERLKVGQWLAFSRIKYDVFGVEDITLFTNSFSMYVPPVQWLTERWRTTQEYPYPHVRLSLEKDAFLNQTSNRLHIQVNVTHEGTPNEAPTTGITVYERILTDYVNTSEGTSGILDVRVNGESIMDSGKVEIGVKENLGVIWVKIGPLRLEPGETKRIEIVVATKDTVSDVSLHGTIVKYNFGKFKPEEKEDTEEAMGAENESEESTTKSLKVELASIYTRKKEDNTVSTSSNTVPLVQVLAPEPGGDTPLPDSEVLFIASIALVVALVASTVYYIAKRKRKTQLSV